MLGDLGLLHGELDQTKEARAELENGERILREQGAKLELAKLLCTRGKLDLQTGVPNAARAALEEAASLAEAVGAGPESALGMAVTELREALDTDSRDGEDD